MATRVYQTAITSTLDRETMELRVGELFADLGFGEPPVVYDPSGEYLQAQIIGDDGVGHCLLIGETGEPCLGLARSLSVLLDERLPTYEVSIETDGDPADAPMAPRVRAVEVEPDGSVRDMDAKFDVDDDIICDDRHKLARRLLLALIDEQIAALKDDPVRLWLYREQVEPEPDIAPRLQQLIKDLDGAEDVSLTEISGQQALRFVQPDGTRRMSVVSDDDLALIKERTGRSF